MNLLHLKYAVEVEKMGSISKAAEKLMMSQPNLSKAIRELESSMRVVIFARTTRGVSVTEEGQIFLEYAKGILAQYENMRSHFTASPKHGFRVAVPRSSYIAEAFAMFIGAMDVERALYVSFRETDAMMAIRHVAENGCDFAIIRYKTIFERYFISFMEDKGLSHKELLAADSHILISEQSPLAEKKVLNPSDLEGLIEITNDDFSMPKHYPGSHPLSGEEEGARKQIFVYERGSQFDILSHVPSTYMWVSPMPEDVLNRNRLVQKRCIADGIGFKDVLVFLKDHAFNEVEKLFLEKLEQAKTGLDLP